MSTQLSGYVEVKLFNDWFSVINAGIIFPHSYDIYGCLFGVRNLANFDPLFPNRGLPPNSAKIDGFEAFCYGTTWCSFAELKNIDYEEEALAPDTRIIKILNDREPPIRVKQMPQNDEERASAQVMKRKDALLAPEFQLLVELMSVLAKQYGDEGVRLVVCFCD